MKNERIYDVVISESLTFTSCCILTRCIEFQSLGSVETHNRGIVSLALINKKEQRCVSLHSQGTDKVYQNVLHHRKTIAPSTAVDSQTTLLKAAPEHSVKISGFPSH